MNENKAVPNIRFNDFENKWEKEKLNQIVKKVTRKNSKLQTSLSLTISAECGIINQNLFFNRQIASRDMSNYFLIKQGEFAYNKSYSKSAPFGTIKRLNRYNQGALSSLYIVFCPTKVDSDYLVSYFDSSYWYKQLSMISTEGVRNHGLLNVSPNDFFDMNLSIPYDDKEQQKIGDFFSRLDKLLDLQQQKIDKLELLKKALLQKLFPKHDAKIPELRFKGFEDVWRKHRLKEVSKIIGGGTPDTKNPKYWNGNINWFSPNEIGNSPYAVSSHKKITDLGLKKSSAKLHPAEKTILFTSRAGIGDMAILTKAAATNQGFQSLELNNNVDSYFVYSYGFEIKKKANRLASGSTFLEISKNEMEKITLMFPSEQEQQRIGNFLSKVDQLIELENKKLQNFQQVKKCLLQNMFVE